MQQILKVTSSKSNPNISYTYFTSRTVTLSTEWWRTYVLVMQLILSPPATWAHLPSNQWKKQNPQRPPISCMVVRPTTQHLWGCRADRASTHHEMRQIYVHRCSQCQYSFPRIKECRVLIWSEVSGCGGLILTHILDGPTDGKRSASSL